jgi:hypothetical protein
MSTTLGTIVQLAKDRIRDQTGQSIDFTQNGFRAINSTLQIWNEVHDWPWTIKNVNFNYNAGINTYQLDGLISDFKYPLTLKYYKPQGKYQEYWMVSPLRFDSAYIYSDRFAIQNLAGVQTLRVKSNCGLSASINTATSYNSNGTWVGAGAISTVGTNNYEGYNLSSSVSFTFNGTTGTLTNSTFTALDLSIFQNRGNIYFDVYLPSVTNVTSFSLEWGSDASNYFSASMTTNYLGQPFAVGWNRLKASWSNIPTTVGTPVVTAINYVQLTMTCSMSTNVGQVLFQNVFVAENIPITLTYYSTNMVTQASDSTQYQVFQNPANTSDFPLWSGRWDIAQEAFIDSLMQILFWMTGEFDDMQIAMSKIQDIIMPLKQRYPSQRRYPTMQIVPDINFQSGGPSSWYDGNPDF